MLETLTCWKVPAGPARIPRGDDSRLARLAGGRLFEVDCLVNETTCNGPGERVWSEQERARRVHCVGSSSLLGAVQVAMPWEKCFSRSRSWRMKK